jgi:hypothetical protein
MVAFRSLSCKQKNPFYQVARRTDRINTLMINERADPEDAPY